MEMRLYCGKHLLTLVYDCVNIEYNRSGIESVTIGTCFGNTNDMQLLTDKHVELYVDIHYEDVKLTVENLKFVTCSIEMNGTYCILKNVQLDNSHTFV